MFTFIYQMYMDIYFSAITFITLQVASDLFFLILFANDKVLSSNFKPSAFDYCYDVSLTYNYCFKGLHIQLIIIGFSITVS